MSWCWAAQARQAGERGHAAGGPGHSTVKAVGLLAFGATEGWVAPEARAPPTSLCHSWGWLGPGALSYLPLGSSYACHLPVGQVLEEEVGQNGISMKTRVTDTKLKPLSLLTPVTQLIRP